jgi:hypothetical protein
LRCFQLAEGSAFRFKAVSRKGAKEDAKAQSKTKDFFFVSLRLPLRLCVKPLFVSVLNRVRLTTSKKQKFFSPRTLFFRR